MQNISIFGKFLFKVFNRPENITKSVLSELINLDRKLEAVVRAERSKRFFVFSLAVLPWIKEGKTEKSLAAIESINEDRRYDSVLEKIRGFDISLKRFDPRSWAQQEDFNEVSLSETSTGASGVLRRKIGEIFLENQRITTGPF